jgi:hypothetical protein
MVLCNETDAGNQTNRRMPTQQAFHDLRRHRNKKSPQRSFVENRNLFHDLKSEENSGMNIIDRDSFNNYTRRENSGNKQI